MIKSTLCYIEQADCLLMLYRNKKQNDPNAGKWVGIGGKIESGESADEAMLRETYEETALVPESYSFLGIIEFRNDSCEDEDMYLYKAYLSTSDASDCSPFAERRSFIVPGTTEPVEGFDTGIDCNEGELAWIRISDILRLNLWEGDRYFLEPLLAGNAKINLHLTYHADKLLSVSETH